MLILFGILFVVSVCAMCVGVVMGLSDEVNESGASLAFFLSLIVVVITGIFYYQLALFTMFTNFVNDNYKYETIANCKVVIKDNKEVVYRVCDVVPNNNVR